jgi:hypothetical protein
VIGVAGGVLRVATKSSVWSNELTFYKADILKRLNARLGCAREPVITEILFQNRGVRRGGKNDGDETVRLAPAPEELDDVALSDEEIATIERGVAAVADETLRDRLRALRVADARLRTWRLDNGWLPCPRCGDLAPPDPRHGDGDTAGAATSCASCRVARRVSG